MIGHRVLLVDLDPQANATSGLGVQDIDPRKTTYDILMGEAQVDDVITPSLQDRLDILPAQRDLVGAEVELVQAIAREQRLAEALAPVRDRYDAIIADCPPSLGLLTINGLTAADGVLVPLQAEYYALEGLSALMDTITLIRQRLNPNLAIEGIVLTMFDTRNSLSHQVAEEVRRHFGGEVFRTVIPRNVRLSESPGYGVPVAHYDATSKGALAYLDLAREFMPVPEHEDSTAESDAVSPKSSETPEVEREVVGDGNETPGPGQRPGSIDHTGEAEGSGDIKLRDSINYSNRGDIT